MQTSIRRSFLVVVVLALIASIATHTGAATAQQATGEPVEVVITAGLGCADPYEYNQGVCRYAATFDQELQTVADCPSTPAWATPYVTGLTTNGDGTVQYTFCEYALTSTPDPCLSGQATSTPAEQTQDSIAGTPLQNWINTNYAGQTTRELGSTGSDEYFGRIFSAPPSSLVLGAHLSATITSGGANDGFWLSPDWPNSVSTGRWGGNMPELGIANGATETLELNLANLPDGLSDPHIDTNMIPEINNNGGRFDVIVQDDSTVHAMAATFCVIDNPCAIGSPYVVTAEPVQDEGIDVGLQGWIADNYGGQATRNLGETGSDKYFGRTYYALPNTSVAGLHIYGTATNGGTNDSLTASADRPNHPDLVGGWSAPFGSLGVSIGSSASFAKDLTNELDLTEVTSTGRLDITVQDDTVVDEMTVVFCLEQGQVFTDSDGDGTPDHEDNCVWVWNGLQADSDGDGIGDLCDLPAEVSVWTGSPESGTTLVFFGCPGGTVTATVSVNGTETYVATMDEQISGEHFLQLFPDVVPQGTYEVTFTSSCGDSIAVTTGIGYHDPSGLILNQLGQPIEGATVTLLYSSTEIIDPYSTQLTAVPDGSTIMSPDNRLNPMPSGADGYYGWDTIEGWFVVSAVAPGCTNPADGSAEVRSEVLPVLPEHFNVDLTFNCPIDPAAGRQGFVPITPCSPFDTRESGSPATGQTTLTAQITELSACQVPIAATGAMINVVAVSPLVKGNLRISEAGVEARGGIVNFGPGNTASGTNSNAVPVALSDTGKVDIFVNAAAGVAATHVRLVVLGYYVDPQEQETLGFSPITPCAVFDSRTANGAPVPGRTPTAVQITGPTGQTGQQCAEAGPVPAGAIAAMINVVAVEPTGAGNLRISAAGTAAGGGVVNFGPGATASGTNSNAVPVRLSAEGAVDLFVNGPATHVRLVVLGYYVPSGGDNAGFVPVAPCAVHDTRQTANIPTGQQRVTAQISGSVAQSGEECAASGIVPADAKAVMINVVAVNPVRNGNLRISASGTQPTGGVVNFGPGATGAGTNSNAVPVKLSPSGAVDVFVNAQAGAPATHVRLVVVGYYT